MSGVQLTSTDFTRAAAEDDSFVGWVQAMKERFRQQPAPVAGDGFKPVLASVRARLLSRSVALCDHATYGLRAAPADP